MHRFNCSVQKGLPFNQIYLQNSTVLPFLTWVLIPCLSTVIAAAIPFQV